MRETVLIQALDTLNRPVWVTMTFTGISARRAKKKLAKAGLRRVAGFGYKPAHYNPAMYIGRV